MTVDHLYDLQSPASSQAIARFIMKADILLASKGGRFLRERAQIIFAHQ